MVVAALGAVCPSHLVGYRGGIRNRRQWWLFAAMVLCDTVIRYQYNVVRIVDSTWPASGGTVMLVMVWGWLVWQRVSASGRQSPRET